MKYFKFWNDYDGPVDAGFTYVESNDGWPIRQITACADKYIGSNVRNAPNGLILGDQKMDDDKIESIDEIVWIEHKEFEAVWEAHLNARMKIWNVVKERFPIGIVAEGAIEVFYPQGVIVDLGNEALAVADYNLCKASTRPENMYPKHKVTATVSGYDERNQWIILESPKVHATLVSS